MIVTNLMTFFIRVRTQQVKQIAFTNTKTMIFCSEIIQELFINIFKAKTLFGKLNNEYPNTKIF